MSYHWPGNVRELKNAVERAVIMSRGTTIGPNDIIPRHLRSGGEMPAALTIPVGATAAEARRSSCCGPSRPPPVTPRARARCSGCRRSDVRAELLALLHGAGDASASAAPADNGAEPAAPRAARRAGTVATPARAAAKKPTAKKGR